MTHTGYIDISKLFDALAYLHFVSETIHKIHISNKEHSHHTLFFFDSVFDRRRLIMTMTEIKECEKWR